MRDSSLGMRRRILAFSAIAEAGTGLAAMVAPAFVVALLLLWTWRTGHRDTGVGA